MNKSEIRTRIADVLDDADMVFFTSAQIDTMIKEGAEIIAEETHAIRRTAYFPLRQGTQFYFLRSIAQDIMMPYRIWNHDGTRRLTAYSIDEMDAFSENWMATTGTPAVWFSVSWEYFGIYPKPAEGGGVMRLDYYAWPRELMDDDDEPEILEQSHDALIKWGSYEGELKQWDGKAAQTAQAMFLAEIGQATDRSNVGRVQERNFQRSALRLPSTMRSRV